MKQLGDRIYVDTSYPGVNVGAVVSRRGTVCIDAPTFPRDSRHWATRVHQLHPSDVSYLILTSAHGDRVLNSRWMAAPIIAHSETEACLVGFDKRYPQTMLDSLIARNPTCARELANGPVERPGLSFSTDLRIVVGKRPLELLHMPGPSDGTTWVHLPEDGILFTSDTVLVDEHPLLAEADCAAWLESLELLLEDPRFEGVHTIVPGRGPLAGKEAVEPVLQYVQEAQRLVQEHLAQRRSRESLYLHIPELAAHFPNSPWPIGWTTRQLRAGLEHLYDALKLEEPAHTV